MRRNAVTLLLGLFLVSTLSGCALFKKKEAAAEPYDPATEAATTEPYPTYPTTYGGSPSVTSGGRTHTVAKGETLFALARQYYHDQARWKDIYAANRTDISDPNRIRVGQRLVIP